MPEKKCFLCGNEEVEVFYCPESRYSHYRCSNCGDYEVDKFLEEIFDRSEYYPVLANNENRTFATREILSKAACIAAERYLKKQDGYFLASRSVESKPEIEDIIDFIADFPADPIDRFNRALLNLGKIAKDNPFSFILIENMNYYSLFALSIDDMENLLSFMKTYEYVELKIAGQYGSFSITPQGWAKIAELQEQYKEHSNKAFLAMWFNDSTNGLREAAIKAAKQAGYDLRVVDQEHHNDFIMNKVLNMIDESKFIIADFTCREEEEDNKKVKGGVRGGVYYEAGFAEGQGKEVIMTCKNTPEAWASLNISRKA